MATEILNHRTFSSIVALSLCGFDNLKFKLVPPTLMVIKLVKSGMKVGEGVHSKEACYHNLTVHKILHVPPGVY